MDCREVQERLDALATKHGVVGASLAVAHDGEVATAATGLLNTRTGQPVTVDSVFAIGSITKVWTATLVMQLVDDGLVDLDEPIVRHLPAFRVADAEVTRAVTARQLLCHSSGIDGDFFLDTGRGDDALGAFVAAMKDLQQNHPPGAIMSYTNCGYAVLGHLVATLRGATWEAVLRERLLTPLGLSSAGTFPEEAILHGAAIGHVGDTAVDQWGGFRSMGPTGLIHCTPGALIAFAQMHLAGGVTAGGARVLSEDSAIAMATPQIETKDLAEGTHWGLGWALDTWDGVPVRGHGGQLTGQIAFLKVLPELSVALTTNGGAEQGPQALFEDVMAELARDLVGVAAPAALRPPSTPVPHDATPILGTYTRAGFETTVERTSDGVLRAIIRITEGLVGLVPDMTMELVSYDGDDIFLGRFEGSDTWISLVFFEMGGERYLHASGRAFRRTTP